MSIRLTDDETVGLYDSVTGMAFGPVFETATEATEYVDFVNELEGKDPREYTSQEHEKFRTKFMEGKE